MWFQIFGETLSEILALHLANIITCTFAIIIASIPHLYLPIQVNTSEGQTVHYLSWNCSE